MRASKRRATDPRTWVYGPSETVAWMAVVYLVLVVWRLPLTPLVRAQGFVFLLTVCLFLAILFHWLLPSRSSWAWTHRLGIVGTILALGWAYYLLGSYGMRVDLFMVVVIAIAGIVSDRRTAMGAALLAFIVEMICTILSPGPATSLTAFFPLKLVLYLAAGYIASAQTSLVRQQSEHVARHNTELAFLQDTGAIATSSLDLDTVFPQLAERIVNTLPTAYCRLCLLDQHQGRLSTHGVSHAGLLSLQGWQPVNGELWSLQDMPRLHATIANACTTCILVEEIKVYGNEKERQALFPCTIGSICVVPIVSQGTTMGAIIVGEESRAQPQPFDQRKLELLQGLAAQLGVVVQNGMLHKDTERQSKRFAALVEIGRAVSSTLEMADLLELVHQQVSQTLPCDTYFVALYDEKEGVFDIQILFDGGKRFPPQQIRLGEGLATWVILKRKPLLVRNLSEELDSLPVTPLTLGQQTRSESWLGVPIMTQGAILGLLAVASYKPYAFDEDDMAMLSTVAQQTALALDNARHHAQVEEQARRDSLTGVYNHGHLLSLLQDQVTACAQSGAPVSMIMLDIDHFKLYNDQYGHVVGDAVLRLIAQAVKMHVKQSDIVGRWGGEEFAVVLPSATTAAAQAVAERIRSTLTALPLAGADGWPIPKPTVSQGIATYPDHVSSVDELVVAADRALYQAKRGGRDQVSVAIRAPR
jgi:diguanylate cyclase (GGDEF)-like protein